MKEAFQRMFTQRIVFTVALMLYFDWLCITHTVPLPVVGVGIALILLHGPRIFR